MLYARSGSHEEDSQYPCYPRVHHDYGKVGEPMEGPSRPCPADMAKRELRALLCYRLNLAAIQLVWKERVG